MNPHHSTLHVTVLARGAPGGTRTRPIALQKLGGLPLVTHAVRAARELAPASVRVVAPSLAESVKAALGVDPGARVETPAPDWDVRRMLLGDLPGSAEHGGTLLVLPAEVAPLDADTLRRLLERHQATGAAATVLPSARGPHDAESRGDICAFDLFRLAGLELPEGVAGRGGDDLVQVLALHRNRGLQVDTFAPELARAPWRLDTLADLADCAAAYRRARAAALMGSGVVIVDPASTYVDVDVEVGPDSILHPSVFLEGRTSIGPGCEIHAGSRIANSTLEPGVIVQSHCVVQDSLVRTGAVLGPFAHLRPGSEVGPDARVGNFVELKKTRMGRGSKANHLAYLGDATIGDRVNIGAGTITCNYDGVRKHHTTIDDEAFIGSDSQLVAPVTIGRGAYVAAGSSVTQDVPPGALAVARARQTNKVDWATTRREKQKRP